MDNMHIPCTVKSQVRFEVHAGLSRLLMKGIFDAYVLWPFSIKFIFQLVLLILVLRYMYRIKSQVLMLVYNL